MRESRNIAVRTASIYAVLAGLWILLSDYGVNVLPPAIAIAAQSAKGLLFVALTAIVLYVLIERLADRIRVDAISANSVEKMLGQVVSASPVGIVLTGDDGTVTFLNAKAEEMFGLAAAEAIGRVFDEACCVNGPQSTAMLGELMRVGWVDDLAVGGRGGEPLRHVLARAAQVHPGVPASGWVFALSDISDTQRKAATYKKQIGGYRFLAQALETCIRATSPEQLMRRIAESAVSSGRYVAAWATLHNGHAFEDVAMVGMGPHSQGIADLLRERALASPQLGSNGKESELVVANDITRDPANVWHPASAEEGFGAIATLSVMIAGHPVARLTLFAPEPGAFTSTEMDSLKTLLDEITFSLEKLRLEHARLETEVELEHSERGYRALFESHPAPLWVFDVESLQFLAVNDAAVEKYGYSRKEFLHMTVRDIRPEDEVMQMLSSVNHVDRFKDAGVWTHVDKHGREFPVHVYSHSLEWDGHEAELVMALEVAQVV